jgi:hypothetical protein
MHGSSALQASCCVVHAFHLVQYLRLFFFTWDDLSNSNLSRYMCNRFLELVDLRFQVGGVSCVAFSYLQLFTSAPDRQTQQTPTIIRCVYSRCEKLKCELDRALVVLEVPLKTIDVVKTPVKTPLPIRTFY